MNNNVKVRFLMNHFQWEKEVPVYKNRFILKGIAVSIGVPLVIISVLIFIISRGALFGVDAVYAYGLLVVFFLLVSFLLLIVYKGRYAPGFIVDEEGIINYVQLKSKNQGRLRNLISIVLELFSRNYKAHSSVFPAQFRQVLKIKWGNVTKIKLYPRQHAILVKSDFTDKIAVFCTKDNYEEVSHMIYKMASKQKRSKYS